MKYLKYIIILFIISNINLSFADEQEIKLKNKITKNLRCLICQGQSIYDSDSQFAIKECGEDEGAHLASSSTQRLIGHQGEQKLFGPHHQGWAKTALLLLRIFCCRFGPHDRYQHHMFRFESLLPDLQLLLASKQASVLLILLRLERSTLQKFRGFLFCF